MDEKLIRELKSQLEKEKERLEKELVSFAKKDPKISDNWETEFPIVPTAAGMSHVAQEEQADIREEYEAELAQEQSLELRLREVNGALKSIGRNTYGLCKTCGKPIPEDRLRANPAAEYDVSHQPRE